MLGCHLEEGHACHRYAPRKALILRAVAHVAEEVALSVVVIDTRGWVPELEKLLEQADLPQRAHPVDTQPEADAGDAVVGLDVDDVDMSADLSEGRSGGQAADTGTDDQELHRFCHGVSSLSSRRVRAGAQSGLRIRAMVRI